MQNKPVKMRAWEFMLFGGALVWAVSLIRDLSGGTPTELVLAVAIGVTMYLYWGWKQSPQFEESVLLLGCLIGLGWLVFGIIL